jgi:hypothetical protein
MSSKAIASNNLLKDPYYVQLQIGFTQLFIHFLLIGKAFANIARLLIQGCQMVFFTPKVPIWVFLGACNGKGWYIFGLFYGQLV